MPITEERTVDVALAKFRLVKGTVGGGDSACAMSLLGWVAGEPGTDHPECANRLLADLAIKGNDADSTTVDEQERIVRAGATGILDTWWVPDTVVAAALASLPEGLTDAERSVKVSEYVTAWKGSHEKPNLADANLTGANLADANLTGANLSRANLSRADLAGAYGNRWTVLPVGWVVDEGTGLIRRTAGGQA